uniref:Cap-specific mRNA (nucleoside-2'-O-)-methyltransferase 1 n=1 Tax=Romanomermis culicivorax TaxID=13658 RepID=A0A915K602_ROMCU
MSVCIMEDDECPNFCPYAAHGFGFTLQGKDDFKLDKMLAACPEMFETHYGAAGPTRADNRCGDGDVTNPQNLINFTKFVQKSTAERGVQLFMADGGFSVEGRENIQEILSKRLYLCQILCAFKILAKGGNLVCKLFDVFTPFSAGLLYLMWRSFDKICLHKPHTSRPANSERYVLAFGFLGRNCQQIIDHLWAANLEYDRLSQEELVDSDVLELVPLNVLRESESFCDYLTQSNEKMAKRQILFLNKYKIFARNKMLYDQRQADIRSKCLTYWHIPDMLRPNSRGYGAENRLRELLGNDIDWLKAPVPTFSPTEVNNFFDANNFLSYRCALSTKTPYLIVGLGGQQVQLWNSNRFDRAPQEFKIALPKDTVIFGELTEEFDSEAKNPSRRSILRIFDACFLSGKDISKLPYYNSKCTDRVQQISKFCKAISQEFSRCDLTIVRAVETIDFNTLFYGLHDRLKTVIYRNDEKLSCRNINHHFFHNEYENHEEKEKFSDSFLHVNGLMCYKITADPWTIHYSKKKKAYFFYNKTLNPELQSTFNPPSDCFADFKQIFMNRKAIALPKHARSATTSNNDDGTYLNQFLHILKTIDSKNPMRGEHH